MVKVIIWTAVMIATFTCRPAFALDNIPTTSGFSGYILVGPSYFNVANSRLVRGSPLLRDVGNPLIKSINDAPAANGSPALLIGVEVNYTFAGTRTQLYLGNRLEDLFRLDLVFGLGVRQELPDESILAVSVLATPVELKYWADPYVEGVDRQGTHVNFPGVRLRWGRILHTGLELTVTDRFYRYDEEKSGTWLVSEGRIAASEQPLLQRDGDILRLRVLYRFDVAGRHRFEPSLRWVNDRHDGAAVANKGFGLQLTYLYRSPKVLLDANIALGRRKADTVHPAYGQVLESTRGGVALNVFFPVTLFHHGGWNAFVGAEYFRENANVDFFDSEIGMVMAGLAWRHRRP